MIVLDASALVELSLPTALGRRVADRIAPPDVQIAIPYLADVEVCQVLRRWVFRGALSADRGRLALEHLAALDATRWPHDPLLPRIWELRDNLTAYDAAYVVLTETLEATLVTCDTGMATVAGSLCPVEHLG